MAASLLRGVREARRLPLTLLPALFCLLAPALAHADDAEAPAVPEDLPRLVLDTGRIPKPKADPNYLRLHLRGELQIRGQVMRSFPLDPSATTLQANPGATGDSIGQNAFVTQWIRLTPELTWRDKLRFISQIDLLQGYVFGQTTHDVGADAFPRDNGGDAWTYVRLRWLYGEWRSPIGLFRLGQMSNHWGMGVLANDGDHPPLFGDYRGGNIQEQLLFATKPAGEESPFVLAAAFSLVYQDAQARLTRGDVAFQGVLSGFYEKGPNQLGVFSVLRSQSTGRQSGADTFTYDDNLVVGAVDVAGHFAVPVPGNEDTFLFGAAEGAVILGSTNILRQPDQAASGQKTAIRSYGGAAAIGFVHRKSCTCGVTKSAPMGPPDAPNTFGSVVAQLEVGYASGDANPYDDVERRFTFDPNHKIGMLLFDEVMRWQTARASTAAQDPLLSNGNRPTPGVNLLPSNGGVFGATYINPTFIYRPVPILDVKAGAVLAQSTADVVDPYRLATQGAYVNYRGGDPKRHDLGLELDLGVEGRFKLDDQLRLQLGAQGAILFPGGALADAGGATLNTPWLVTGRVGLQF